jgi:hypothetical protein
LNKLRKHRLLPFCYRIASGAAVMCTEVIEKGRHLCRLPPPVTLTLGVELRRHHCGSTERDLVERFIRVAPVLVGPE